MTKDLRRKKKKSARAKRQATRHSRAVVKATLRSGDELRLSRTAIEAEIKVQLTRLDKERAGSDDYDAQIQTIGISRAMVNLNVLQSALFRLVFGRESKPYDPRFWDRERELEGVFPMDPDKATNDFVHLLAMASRHPEIRYAMDLTGMYPFRQRLHLYPKEALAQWQRAVEDYVHQAATGVPPVDPDTLMDVLEIATEVLEISIVIPSRIAEVIETAPDRIIAAVEHELGKLETTQIALNRLTALTCITEVDEFRKIFSPEGYSEEAMIAAASAEIDRQTGRFVLASFRERHDAASTAPRIWTHVERHDIV